MLKSVSRMVIKAAEGLRGSRSAFSAGKYYPEDRKELLDTVERYMTETPTVKNPKILIVPHAGYEYSGAIAGKAYASIGPGVTKVVIVAPAHSDFKAARIPDHTAYSTPLGEVPLMKETANIPRGEEDNQHSVEVHLPFLQARFPKLKILPILTGEEANPRRIAEGLKNILAGDDTVLIVSSDLSHHHPLRRAKSLDNKTLKTIENFDENGEIDACGEPGIRAAMLLARRMGLKPTVIARGYSSEEPGASVVGYASVTFSKEEPEKEASSGQSWKRDLLDLAEESVEAAVKGVEIGSSKIPSIARKPYGAFVTLTKAGKLRGCMGSTEADQPLYKAVIENARKAATRDPRFLPVTPGELDDISVEVSVLSDPKDLDYDDPDDLLDKLKVGRDGVILSKDGKSATYLPQVWEDMPDKNEFLESLSEKAGLPKDAWKSADIRTYRVVKISE